KVENPLKTLLSKIGGPNMANEPYIEPDDDVADTLIAISVISKLLARKITEERQHEQNETTE
ncbi:hypothetical protein, partial [Streptococcus agalactiae]|uniref:hypothetical protein n=1 Tax=Streptococcus agalactiae TaxID=1311 RepID=UPI00362CD2C3